MLLQTEYIQIKQELSDQGLLSLLVECYMSDSTLLAMAIQFIVLCVNIEIYLIKYHIIVGGV